MPIGVLVRRPHTVRLLTIVVLVGMLASAAGRGMAASSSVVVTMDVTSSVSITDQCTDPRGFRFGTVQPGTPALTATGAGVCRVQFASSNDSAMLRAAQSDGAGVAMTSSSLAWDETSWGDGNISEVSFAPGTTTGWAVGTNGLLLQSTDGGASWSPHTCTPCGTRHLHSVSAASTSAVFVGSSSGKVFRWNGTTWEELTAAGQLVNVSNLDAVDASTVWIATGSGYMFKSTNANVAAASVTWTQYRPTTVDFNGIDAVDANAVFAVGNSGVVARTTNGGGDLVATTTSSLGSIRDVAAVSATSAVVANSGGSAFDTTDGTTWTARSTGMRELVTDLERNGSTVYAAGELGRVAKSTDGGITWSVVRDTPMADSIFSLAIVNGSTTLVGGGRGKQLLRSTDDGASWSFRNASASPNLVSVAAVTESEAFAVGESGALRHTTNAGASWAAQASPTTETLRGIAVSGLDGDRLVAVGDAGAIVSTTDAGATWTLRSSGTVERLRGVTLVEDRYAWAVGDNGTILRSTDGGVRWSAQASGTTLRLNDVVAVSRNIAWAVGGAATSGGSKVILATTDGGASWTQQVSTTGSEFSSVDAVSATHAMAMGFDGRLYRTTDGSTWSSAVINGGRAYAVSMASDEVAYASYYGTVQRSVDGGTTWTSVSGVSWHSFKGLDALDPDTVIATAGSLETGVPLAGGSLADYGASPNAWSGASTASLFGVCLQAVGAGTTAVWTADAAGLPAQCEASDGDPWRSIPTAPSKIATAGAGTTGQADFVFGVRPAASQPPGAYYAGVTFEALAPAV